MKALFDSLTAKDLKHLQQMGFSPQALQAQSEMFQRGTTYVPLVRPCKVGDGIRVVDEKESAVLKKIYEKKAPQHRIVKFIPASGAASRMFRVLSGLFRNLCQGQGIEKQAPTVLEEFEKLINNLPRFPFYQALQESLREKGVSVEDLIRAKEFEILLEALLTPSGLGLAKLPKAVIGFHRYGKEVRTALEEHLRESLHYVQDKQGRVRIHLVVSPERETLIQKCLGEILKKSSFKSQDFGISCSFQEKTTDTLALDEKGLPVRDKKSELVLRPGGHGALIHNLKEVDAEIVFIKNIDNVVPDALQETVGNHKKILGGLLLQTQKRIHEYLKKMDGGEQPESFFEDALLFMKEDLGIDWGEPELQSYEAKRAFIFEKLNRPLRVCGMVKNEGEPGGGPFWVEDKKGHLSLQIVESSQVNMDESQQQEIWRGSTHFNPVDIVCTLKDYLGRTFDLSQYVDDETYFMSTKYQQGKHLRALEWPGLWNGAMARWITLFVEVPIETFNPVKTVMDLLRDEHQVETP